MSLRTILVTGANRGIGFSIVQALATSYPSNRYLLGTRDEDKGREAVSQLRDLGVKAEMDVIPLEVSSESSIKSAAQSIRTKYKTLDILINNAGVGRREAPDHSNLQEVYSDTLQTNVIGVALMMSTFLPLLKESPDPRVINVSSLRGSLNLSTTGQLPPTASVSYCVSKSALNMLTMEHAKTEQDVAFHVACPGFCKTAFNGYKGYKDPLDGAKVVVQLAMAEQGRYPNGFWQIEGEQKEPTSVPW